MDKLRIYAVSLLAISDVQSYEEPAEPSTFGRDLPIGSIIETLPALIPSESMEAVIADCRTRALEQWKPEEGWRSHQANIMVVTKHFYDAAMHAYHSGVIDMSDEPPRTVNL